MFAVMGVTGQVGSVVARTLLAAGKNVRVVVRSEEKGDVWRDAGCEVAVADLQDTDLFAQALAGTEAVFVVLPPNFDPSPDFHEPRLLIEQLAKAIDKARPGKVVCLSTVGAQATQPNLLQSLGRLENALRVLPVPVTFLRAAWFIENFVWNITNARDDGVLPSFLQPPERRIPMVATADIGRVAAELLQTTWQGMQLVELEGPERLSPQDIAASFSRLLGRDVEVKTIAAEQWPALFAAQGMLNPLPRIQMLNGFNEGWLTFETTTHKGVVNVDTVLRQLIERSAQASI